MARERMLVPLVLATCLALTACTELVVPDGPTDEEIDAYHAQVLDATWGRLDLPEGTPRPVTADPKVLSPSAWWTALSECLTPLGADGWQVWSEDRAYFPMDTAGGQLSVEQKFGWYACFEQYRRDPVESGELMTQDQRDYLWTYYEAWLMPCLRHSGYRVESFPSRIDFDHSALAVWTPYYSVVESFPSSQFDELRTKCGPSHGALPSW